MCWALCSMLQVQSVDLLLRWSYEVGLLSSPLLYWRENRRSEKINNFSKVTEIEVRKQNWGVWLQSIITLYPFDPNVCWAPPATSDMNKQETHHHPKMWGKSNSILWVLGDDVSFFGRGSSASWLGAWAVEDITFVPHLPQPNIEIRMVPTSQGGCDDSTSSPVPDTVRLGA